MHILDWDLSGGPLKAGAAAVAGFQLDGRESLKGTAGIHAGSGGSRGGQGEGLTRSGFQGGGQGKGEHCLQGCVEQQKSVQ